MDQIDFAATRKWRCVTLITWRYHSIKCDSFASRWSRRVKIVCEWSPLLACKPHVFVTGERCDSSYEALGDHGALFRVGWPSLYYTHTSAGCAREIFLTPFYHVWKFTTLLRILVHDVAQWAQEVCRGCERYDRSEWAGICRIWLEHQRCATFVGLLCKHSCSDNYSFLIAGFSKTEEEGAFRCDITYPDGRHFVNLNFIISGECAVTHIFVLYAWYSTMMKVIS